MIALRRNNQRQRGCDGEQELWHTFRRDDRADAPIDGFGALRIFDEDRLPPGGHLTRYPCRDAEIVTYVRQGALTQQDATGWSGVIQAGEFQRMTICTDVRHTGTNASRTDWAHVFTISLRPWQAGLEPGHEQRRFSVAERRGLLCAVASPDGRRGSLRVHQDARVYSAILDPGQHVVHALSPGRIAWLHVVHGEATIGDVVVTAGDAVGATDERAVSLTARELTELLLIDLAVDTTKGSAAHA